MRKLTLKLAVKITKFQLNMNKQKMYSLIEGNTFFCLVGKFCQQAQKKVQKNNNLLNEWKTEK